MAAQQTLNVPFRPTRRHLELVDECAQLIAPDDDGLDLWFANYYRNARFRIASDLDMITSLSEGVSKIAEIGSIPLLLTLPLKRLGYDVTGVDLEPERFSRAISLQELNIVKCNIETERVPLEDATFDIVLFNELFEHLRINPIFTLGEVRRVLKDDGILLLSTPNLKSIRGIYNFLVKDKGFALVGNIYQEYEKLQSTGHMGHVREYTTTEIREFLERMGFRVERFEFRGEEPNPVARLVGQRFPRFRRYFTCVARAK